MASAGAGLVNQCSSATDESVVTSSSNDHEGFATLDPRRSITLVALVLVDGKRLSSNSGLINLEESIVGDNATISWNDSTLVWLMIWHDVMARWWTYFLDLKNVTWDNLRSLNLKKTTIAKDDSLECKSLL